MNERLNFAILGCGNIGETHAQVIQTLDHANLAVVCDLNEAAGRRMAAQFGCRFESDYHTVLQDELIDVVSVCLPSGLHYQAVIDSALAGKHVITEKPIEVDLSRAQEMVTICRENHVCFSVILQHRFDPSVVALKKAQERGDFGRILWGSARTIWFRDTAYYENSSWHGTWKLDGGGALMNQSIHMIDLLLYFLGRPKSVSGTCAALLHPIETEDIGLASIVFENGSLGSIEGTTLAYPGFYSELALYGEKGSAVIRNHTLSFYQFQSGKNSELEKLLHSEAQEFGKSEPTVDLSSHRLQYQDFIRAVCNHEKPAVTGEDGLSSLALIQDIYRSSKEKRVIDFGLSEFEF